MRLLLAAFFLAAPLAVPLAAHAATPAAWASLDTAARKACERDITRIAAKARVRAVDGKVFGIGPAKDEDRFYARVAEGRNRRLSQPLAVPVRQAGRTAVAREMN